MCSGARFHRTPARGEIEDPQKGGKDGCRQGARAAVLACLHGLWLAHILPVWRGAKPLQTQHTLVHTEPPPKNCKAPCCCCYSLGCSGPRLALKEARKGSEQGFVHIQSEQQQEGGRRERLVLDTSFLPLKKLHCSFWHKTKTNQLPNFPLFHPHHNPYFPVSSCWCWEMLIRNTLQWHHFIILLHLQKRSLWLLSPSSTPLWSPY